MIKIRHVLEPNNLYAVYFLEKEPWAQVVPCLHQALVDRTYYDDEHGETVINEIIGFVVTTEGIVPADEAAGHIFMWYVDANRLPLEGKTLVQYQAEMMVLSQQQWQSRQPPPPPPEAITRVFEQRKGQQNGKSKRRPQTQTSV